MFLFICSFLHVFITIGYCIAYVIAYLIAYWVDDWIVPSRSQNQAKTKLLARLEEHLSLPTNSKH